MAPKSFRAAVLALLLGAAFAVWDFTGELPTWRPNFPDFDCRRLHGSDDALDWDTLRLQLEASPPGEWRDIVFASLGRVSFGLARGLLDDFKQPECPFGTLFLALISYRECASGGDGCPEPDLTSDVAQRLLRTTSVELLIGTRWPVLAALDSLAFSPYYDDARLSCEDLETPALDWPRLWKAFSPAGDWFRDARPLVYDRGFQADWLRALAECPYGFAMVALWKLTVCAETQGECVSQYSHFVDDLIQTNDWREVAGNRWPIFGFLDRVRKPLLRHEFFLDFSPAELRGEFPSGLLPGPLLDSSLQPLERAVSEGAVSRAFADVLRSILAGVPRSYAVAGPDGAGMEVRWLLYATMVFGPRYVPYIPRFVARAIALGLSNLVLFCLDGPAYDLCISLPNGHEGKCVRGTPSILNKFTLPLAYLQLGIDVFWLDFDVFLMRDPTPRVLGAATARQVDLLVSGSFADDCICSGLVLFRATKGVADWLLIVVSWMYEHVYTHDQQSFSAFLAGRPDEDNATTPEQISSSKLFRLYLNPEVPRWALLDPVTEFVSARVLNTTGWTGDLDRMFIFHFLHGDSEVNQGHSAYGWNARHGFVDSMRPLLDIFYNQSDERIYTDAGMPHERSAEIYEALLASRRPERPREMLHCGVLQLNPYSPGRLSPDG